MTVRRFWCQLSGYFRFCVYREREKERKREERKKKEEREREKSRLIAGQPTDFFSFFTLLKAG